MYMWVIAYHSDIGIKLHIKEVTIMNKRIFLCIVILLLLLNSSILASTQSFNIVVNENEIGSISGNIIENDKMFPLRILCELVDADVKWNETDKTVIINTNNTFQKLFFDYSQIPANFIGYTTADNSSECVYNSENKSRLI